MTRASKTSLADDLAAFATSPPSPHKRGCAVGKLLGSIEPEAAAALRRLIDEKVDGDYPFNCVAISKFMAERGHDIHLKRYQEHRRRTCRCPA